MPFRDRSEAGARLAARLSGYRGRDVVVLGLPRGGVAVARPVAEALGAPLDVLVARKLGAPGQPEFGIGAVTARGTRVLNDRVLRMLMLPPGYLDAETRSQRAAAEARERALRGVRPAEPLAGRLALVVDDGIATGMTVAAAVEDLLTRPPGERPASVVVATPVIAPDTLERLAARAPVVALEAPATFMAVGQFYDDFGQTTDEEVRQLLAAPTRR